MLREPLQPRTQCGRYAFALKSKLSMWHNRCICWIQAIALPGYTKPFCILLAASRPTPTVWYEILLLVLSRVEREVFRHQCRHLHPHLIGQEQTKLPVNKWVVSSSTLLWQHHLYSHFAPTFRCITNPVLSSKAAERVFLPMHSLFSLISRNSAHLAGSRSTKTQSHLCPPSWKPQSPVKV